MTQEQIMENNKLMAEFMGLKIQGHPYDLHHDWIWITVGDKTWTPVCELDSEFLYHSSWDWLMPVVDKIESLEDYDVNMYGEQTDIVEWKNDKYIIKANNGKSRLENTYNAVVEFIKWYNEKKK